MSKLLKYEGALFDGLLTKANKFDIIADRLLAMSRLSLIAIGQSQAGSLIITGRNLFLVFWGRKNKLL